MTALTGVISPLQCGLYQMDLNCRGLYYCWLTPPHRQMSVDIMSQTLVTRRVWHFDISNIFRLGVSSLDNKKLANNYKHSSLPRYRINNSCERFYSTAAPGLGDLFVKLPVWRKFEPFLNSSRYVNNFCWQNKNIWPWNHFIKCLWAFYIFEW